MYVGCSLTFLRRSNFTLQRGGFKTSETVGPRSDYVMANSWCSESLIKKSLTGSSWTMAGSEFSFWPCFVAWIPVDSLQFYPWGFLYIFISWCPPEISVCELLAYALFPVTCCVCCFVILDFGVSCCLNIPEKRQTVMHSDCLSYCHLQRSEASPSSPCRNKRQRTVRWNCFNAPLLLSLLCTLFFRSRKVMRNDKLRMQSCI